MDVISEFLDEMRRSDWFDKVPFNQRKYNDIGVLESVETYHNKIAPMYSAAVIALINVPTEGYKILQSLINEVAECQDCFMIPSDEVLDSLMNDYNKSNHQIPSLKEDYDYLCFVRDCMRTQMDFLQNFKKKVLLSDNKRETNEETTSQQEVSSEAATKTENKSELLKGVAGLAEHLQCGVTKAQQILNSQILQDKGIAYRTGKAWRIDSIKLDKLLNDNPNILYKRNK